MAKTKTPAEEGFSDSTLEAKDLHPPQLSLCPSIQGLVSNPFVHCSRHMTSSLSGTFSSSLFFLIQFLKLIFIGV